MGDEVLVTGYDLGMNTSGGFAEFVRVPSGWVVRKPTGLTLRECMIYGTAGLTAGLCVAQLRHHDVLPDKGEVLVTGASGGVGCVAVMILAKLGYNVVAATGKLNQTDWLKHLGATSVIDRKEVSDNTRPLLRERWAGVVDTVGGDMLSVALKSSKTNGCVAACGNAASPELHTNVYPFILRGVTLTGIDSANATLSVRTAIWEKLAGEWKPDKLEAVVDECGLDGLSDKMDQIVKGQMRGRVVVHI
jgi:putative YhdH/YhfP family quinone oxidoreductase